MQKIGWFGVVIGGTQDRGQCHHSTYDFLFNFSGNYASILYCFRDIASYLSKVADLNPPHLHLASPLGMVNRAALTGKHDTLVRRAPAGKGPPTASRRKDWLLQNVYFTVK